LEARGRIAPSGGSEPSVSGTFSVTNADLGRYQALDGTLKASGDFEGSPRSIRVKGKAGVAGFEARRSGNAFDLSAEYKAVVDATSGDVTLQQATGSFGQTTLNFTGDVSGSSAGSGKTLALDFSSDRARIDDLLRMFTKSPRPALSGPIVLKGHVELPPGSQGFLERLRLDGRFAIRNGVWSKPQMQSKINEMSARARGDKEEVEDGGNADQVKTDLAGKVNMRQGTAALSGVSFNLPGAAASGGGTYNLLSKYIDLRGTVTMSADASEASSGWKSVVLKPFDLLFRRKRQKGATLGVSIRGAYPRPKYAVTLTR
ncbi:MAG TPA: AsmA-like C-terminal region-containing protein, partial [Bryobacteraceae bacterium]|nr:AsmA-like C-terminal region-containing protein [Bryobacteraceae bacterium]